MARKKCSMCAAGAANSVNGKLYCENHVPVEAPVIPTKEIAPAPKKHWYDFLFEGTTKYGGGF